MKQKTKNVLIIGAGPAGCVAAAYLRKKGIQVQLIEKSKFPRFVIGESLIPRCMDQLEEVDLLDCLGARKYEEKHGARFIRGEESCHFDFSDKFTEGYSWTWQVPRADFDQTLANEVMKRGAEIHFETLVIDVKFEGEKSKILLQQKNGEQNWVSADFIIDASGAGRVLPRLLDLESTVSSLKNSAIFTHVNDLKRPKGAEGRLITFDIIETQAWLWVIPFSNGITSIGLVGATDYIERFEGNPSEVLTQILKQSSYYYGRFDDAEFLFGPYQFKNIASKPVKQLYGEGYALTGNSASFLDPVFSSGVALATESGLLAAKLIAREWDGETVDWEKEYTGYLKKGIAVFNSYIREWYTGNLQKVFFHKPTNPDFKRKICAVLAGYVWDNKNQFVRKHDKIINTLAHLVDM